MGAHRPIGNRWPGKYRRAPRPRCANAMRTARGRSGANRRSAARDLTCRRVPQPRLPRLGWRDRVFRTGTGTPCDRTCRNSSRCKCVGAAIRTPSSPPASSIASTLAYAGMAQPESCCRCCADDSAAAVIRTRSLFANARIWVRPIRPAPISPSRNTAISRPRCPLAAPGRRAGDARRSPIGIVRRRAAHPRRRLSGSFLPSRSRRNGSAPAGNFPRRR